MEKACSIIINSPIEKAFAAVDDDAKIHKWMDGKMKTQYLNLKDPENPVGTKFRQKIVGIKSIDGEGEVIAYDKPRLLGIGSNSALAKATIFYHFEHLSDTSTKLTCSVDIATPNIFKRKAISALMPLINRLMRSQLNSLKKLAEE
jgi:uncharacterized protein YndB with AHSA1/START domain